MAATVIDGSAKILSHLPKGWLDVMMRLPVSYRWGDQFKKNMGFGFAFFDIPQIIKDDDRIFIKFGEVSFKLQIHAGLLHFLDKCSGRKVPYTNRLFYQTVRYGGRQVGFSNTAGAEK